MTNDTHDEQTVTTKSSRSHDAALILRVLLIVAIIVVLVAVALDNRKDVRVGYAIGHKQGPIWVVMLCSAVAGVIIGWLLRHRPHRH
jgi:uncharacterized integral membrane protein